MESEKAIEGMDASVASIAAPMVPELSSRAVPMFVPRLIPDITASGREFMM